MKPHTLTKTLVETAVLVGLLVAPLSGADFQKKKVRKKRKTNPAFAKVVDDPKLPRVLLIGDSISIGYTVATQKLLKGKANVHRIPTNGGPTIRGLKHIDKWLGESRWDVIHFNWGLHDLKKSNGNHQVSLDDYETNLRKLVRRLEKTKANLIWCSTTPVPENVRPSRSNDDVLEYNKAAVRVMKEFDIVIDDLYTFSNKRLGKIQRPNNVHFTQRGSKVLASQVVASIQKALPKGDAKSK